MEVELAHGSLESQSPGTRVIYRFKGTPYEIREEWTTVLTIPFVPYKPHNKTVP